MRLLRLFLYTNLIITCSCYLWPSNAIAQSSTDSLFSLTVRQVWSGNPYSIRDIGSYLDDPSLGQKAKQYLQGYTQFTKEEFDWEKPYNRQSFLDFFYENKNRIHFDRSISLYLITPIEEQKFSNFLVRSFENKISPPKDNFKRLVIATEAATTAESYAANLIKLSEIHNSDAWYQLLLFAENAEQKTTYFDPYPSLATALRFCPDINALFLIEKWIKSDKLSPEDAEIPLSELLNCFIPHVTKEYLLALIKMRLKKSTSIPELKKIGYANINAMQPTFFMDSIDYYGLLLSYTGSKPWARNNAIEALIASKNPRSLYYLATLVLGRRSYLDLYKNKTDALQPAFGLLQELTQSYIHVANSKGELSAENIDPTWIFNFLRYWANHYQEYVWDEMRGHFINQLHAETVQEHTENLFARLNSSNDSIALDAFQILTTLSPDLVIPLAEEYRSFGQRTNPVLPSIRLPILDQMTKLTATCRAFDKSWVCDRELEEKTQNLRTIQAPYIRQNLENKLIQNLSLEQVSSIEYQALLYGQNAEFSLSMSRILDHLYAKNWESILNNQEELRFFLKKSNLFKGIGSHGTCNQYLSFLEANKNLARTTLETLLKTEKDVSILEATQAALSALDWSKTPSKKRKPSPPISKSTFNNKIKLFKKATSVDLDEVNTLFQSPHFDVRQHLNVVLNALPKFKNSNEILRLDFPDKLSSKSHLIYFEDVNLNARSLGQLTRLFNGENPVFFFDFYLKKTKNRTFDERGHILTQAFSVHWMVAYLMTMKQESEAAEAIQSALQAYMDESEYLSEYEENQLRFLLLLFNTKGRTIAEKLEAAFQNGVSYRIEQELLAYAKWEDLPSLAPYIEYLKASPDGKPGYLFLNKDFGLPPLAFDKPEVYSTYFSKNSLKKCYATYRKTLIAFGLLNPKLDELSQLYLIIKRERISPYIGGGGFYRDWGVFAAVKLLEDRFAETFGFHEKLNENQTFYIYNSGARAKRWISYLEENNLVDRAGAPSTWQ